MSDYHVYIMASKARTLYIGVTNNLERRVYEHQNYLVAGFTDKYNVERLVYFEATTDVTAAISREKQLKGWRRERKMELITAFNPKWNDLGADWFSSSDSSLRSE